MISKVSDNLPQWFNEAINLLQGTKTATASKQVVAEVNNVKNLPVVKWKNETFYVHFNEMGNVGAQLYNQMGTPTMFIDKATNMEQVENWMHNNEIVASKENASIKRVAESDDDIELVSDTDMDDYIDLEDNDDMTVTASLNEEYLFEEELDEELDEEDGSFEYELERVANTMPTQTMTQVTAPQTPTPTGGNTGVNTQTAPATQQQALQVTNIKSSPTPTTTTSTTTNNAPATTTATTASNKFVSKKKYNQIVARVNKLEKELTKLANYIEAQHAYVDEPLNVDLNCSDLELKHYSDMEQSTRNRIDTEHNMDLTKMSERVKMDETFSDKINGYDVRQDDDIIEIVVDDVPTTIVEIDNLEDVKNFQDKQMCPCCQAKKKMKSIGRKANYIGVQCNNCDTEFAYDENTEKLFQKM